MAIPSILPFDGARYMFVGASATDHHRWPAYFAAYFSLRNPQYTLHYAMDARGGTSISRMFANNEFGWDTDINLSDMHVHYRTVQPWNADFVFIQHAISGGYEPEEDEPEEDALHRESYIENYMEPDSMVPIIINSWQIAEPSYNITGNRGITHINALSAQRLLLDSLDSLIKIAAQPELLSFSIRISDETPFPPTFSVSRHITPN